MEKPHPHLAIVRSEPSSDEPATGLEPKASGADERTIALVLAARDGDPRAQDALLRSHARMMFGLATRLLGRSDHEVDDLVQESMLAAVRSLARLETPQAFSSWLSAIVVRTACKVIRRRTLATRLGLRRRDAPVDVETLVSREASPDVRAELGAIFRCLERLPTRERVALVLRRVDGHSYDEIASLMETSARSAKRWVEAAEDELVIELERGAR